LLLVTNRRLGSRPLLDLARDALLAGVAWIWLRDRDLDPLQRRRLAQAMREATAGCAALVIGGDVDLALESAADGAHLPMSCDLRAMREKLGPAKLMGVSTHSLDDVRAAASAGADYVTLSPIFTSSSKPGYGPALGLSALTRSMGLGCPVLALGGVTPQNAGDCLRAGGAGVAVMGGIFAAPEPKLAADRYLRALSQARVD
jgi:thiamine-phosphate pyrophosphorylase